MENITVSGYSYCNIVGQSDVGKKRKVNEDHGSHFETLNGLVSVVCDGMGGHVGGAVASEVAVRTIHDFLDSQFIQDPREAIGLAIEEANKAILKHVERNPELEGMGSTCVLLIVREGKVYIGHVGDSRIYLIREKNIIQLTKDHSFVQSLVDIGQITKEQAAHHPRKNEITNALGLPGMAPATVRESAIEPQAGDCFLLCSDGLSGMVNDHDIEKIVSRQREYSTQQRADLLVQAANNNGGLDNITVELVEFSVTPDANQTGKRHNTRLLKILIPSLLALAILSLAIIFLWPRKQMEQRLLLPDLVKTSIVQITKATKKNKSIVRVLPQDQEYVIADKIDFNSIESNLMSKVIPDGLEFSIPDSFNSDSAFFVIHGAKMNYRLVANYYGTNGSKTVVLSNVNFKSLAKIGTIYKDSQSIQIAIEGSGNTVTVDDIQSDIEVTPSSVVSQTNDYKIVLQFPKVFVGDEIVISFKATNGDCKYIIPINRNNSVTGSDILRDLTRQKASDINQSDSVMLDAKEVPADSIPKIEEEKAEAVRTVYLSATVPISDKPVLVISDGSIITYKTAHKIDKLPIAELDNNGLSVSDARMKFVYDNDEYIFTVSEPVSGELFLVTILGKDKKGDPIKILFTLKYE